MFASRPSQIIDFLAFAPSYLSLMMPGMDLRVLRMFRLLRFLKLVRYSPAMVTLGRALYEERRALIGATILMMGTAVFSGTVMHVIEGQAQPKAFGTIPDAMWWALATLTTIGYGDAVPITALGKMFGAVVMICGLGLFALADRHRGDRVRQRNPPPRLRRDLGDGGAGAAVLGARRGGDRGGDENHAHARGVGGHCDRGARRRSRRHVLHRRRRSEGRACRAGTSNWARASSSASLHC